MPHWLLKSIGLLLALAVVAWAGVHSSAQEDSDVTVEAGAEGKRILSIELQTRSEGKVFDRAPDSATRHTILGNLRTRVAKTFNTEDLKKDLTLLTDTAHLFRAAEAVVTVDPDPRQDGVRIKLILTQPLVKQVRFLPFWGTAEVRERHRFIGSVDTAVDAEFSLKRLDDDVRRLFESGAFITVRGEHKYTAQGVDVAFRVMQVEPLAIVTFSGVYASGFTSDLERVIAGRKAIRESNLPGSDEGVVSPVYFPRDAFSGDVVTDASAANILGAKEQIKAYYRINGYAFVEVTERVISLPTTYDRAAIEERYGTMRDGTLGTIRGLINDGYGGRTVLIFDVFEGEKLLVGEINFRGIADVESPGNDALSADRISGLFKVVYQFWYAVFGTNADRKAAVLGEVMRMKDGAAFVEADARRDAEAVQAYFQQRGWLDATVSFSGFEVNYIRSRVDLNYTVDPGSVYAVADLRVEYATRAPRVPQGAEPREFDKPVVEFDELIDAMDLSVEQLDDATATARYTEAYVAPLQNEEQGQHFAAFDLKNPLPWDEFQLNGSVAGGEGISGRIRALLADRGYSNADVSFVRVETRSDYVEADWESPFPVRKVGMILKIQQGYQSIVGNVTFRGNTETREDVMRRWVSMYPGDIFDRNKLRASDFRLRRTQWFEQAAPGQGVMSRTSARQITTEDGVIIEYTDIDYDVVEGRTNRINFAAGFNSGTGFTATVDLTLMNFDISSAVSWMWGRPNFSFTGAGQSLSFTAQPPLDRQQIYRINFTEPWLFGYNLYGSISGEYASNNYIDYTRTRLGVDPTLGWRLLPDVTWFYGYSYSILDITDVAQNAPPEIREEAGRDIVSTLWSEIVWSTTDNPSFPTSGFNLSYRFSYSGGPLLGGTIDFWRMRAQAAWYLPIAEIDDVRTLVLALSATAMWQDVHSDTEQIPFIERFQLGGNSVGSRGLLRGFEFGGVGPSRNDISIGGNFMVHGYAELRFPIFPGSLWFVSFLDFGELSPTLNTFDPAGWTVSGGFGLRLLLPILPVPFALDFGFPIINQPGNREQVISINLGFGF